MWIRRLGRIAWRNPSATWRGKPLFAAHSQMIAVSAGWPRCQQDSPTRFGFGLGILWRSLQRMRSGSHGNAGWFRPAPRNGNSLTWILPCVGLTWKPVNVRSYGPGAAGPGIASGIAAATPNNSGTSAVMTRLYSRAALAVLARFGRPAGRVSESPMRKTFGILAVCVALVAVASPAVAQHTRIRLLSSSGRSVRLIQQGPDLLPTRVYLTPSGQLLMLQPTTPAKAFVRLTPIPAHGPAPTTVIFVREGGRR